MRAAPMVARALTNPQSTRDTPLELRAVIPSSGWLAALLPVVARVCWWSCRLSQGACPSPERAPWLIGSDPGHHHPDLA